MASSVPEASSIVAVGETTEGTSTTRQLPSLLDKLKCPTESDLCRKRKVQSLKPTAVKKSHQPGTSNSTDCALQDHTLLILPKNFAIMLKYAHD